MGMRGRIGMVVAALGALALGATTPGAASAQGGEEAVMIAAAEWARDRLPAGSLRLDPHRTGEGVGQAAAERVARALGAQLGTLEDTRRCADVMDGSTCELQSVALLALSMPRIDGDRASVTVYAWYRQSNPREPVAKATWRVQLRQQGGGWEVVSGGR